jgi:hypothetical protein
MGRIAIVAYRPKAGQQAVLEDLMRRHHERLRAEGLVTERVPVLGRAADGTIIEVFEWRSKEAIERAHDNANVRQMWDEYAEVCDYVPLAGVAEARELFSEFEPLPVAEPLRPELSP